MGINYYEVLGIKRDATVAEVKAAYRKVSNVYHSDHVDGLANDALMAEATAAKDTLADADKRRLYNQWLDSQATPAPPPSSEPHFAHSHHREEAEESAESLAEVRYAVEHGSSYLVNRSWRLGLAASLVTFASYYLLSFVSVEHIALYLCIPWGLFWVLPKQRVDRLFRIKASHLKEHNY